MGANRRLPQPESYPIGFLNAIRSGGAVLYAHDIPWTVTSSAKRFRLLLQLIREKPHHELYGVACARWSVRIEANALVVSKIVPGQGPSIANGELVRKALST